MWFRRIGSITIFSVISIMGWSQPQPQPHNPSGDPDAVPITGIEYLLIGGGAYGVSRLLKNKKKKES